MGPKAGAAWLKMAGSTEWPSRPTGHGGRRCKKNAHGSLSLCLTHRDAYTYGNDDLAHRKAMSPLNTAPLHDRIERRQCKPQTTILTPDSDDWSHFVACEQHPLTFA